LPIFGNGTVNRSILKPRVFCADPTCLGHVNELTRKSAISVLDLMILNMF